MKLDPMASYDGSPFLLNAVSDRFEVLLRRYHSFVKDVPQRFQQWLKTAPSQKRVFATLESICCELFPEQLSVVSSDFPQRWMLPVACTALKHHVVASSLYKNTIELSACGRALRIVETCTLQCPSKQLESLLSNDCSSSTRFTLFDAICAASRAAALEVRVAQLESRSEAQEAAAETRKRTRKSVRPESMVEAESAIAYLSECRAEALDALTALRKVHIRGKRYAERLEAAHAEISRLKRENEALLLRRTCAAEPMPVKGLILPKRALSLAGFWNLVPNDLLAVTPTLIDSVKRRGGDVIRRDGMNVCFLSAQSKLLIEAAMEAMATVLPKYERRELE